MNPELHKLLIELEYKVDIDIKKYFKLNEYEKQEISAQIVDFFLPYIKSNDQAIYILRDNMDSMRKEAERFEDYEQADIFNRCVKTLDGLTFLY